MKTKRSKVVVLTNSQLNRDTSIDKLAAIAGEPSSPPRNGIPLKLQEEQIRILEALRTRHKTHSLRPIVSVYDCEGAVQLLAAALSEEPIQFLARPTIGSDNYDFPSEKSFEKAAEYVKANPSASIQYGWLLFDKINPIAIFHAAIRLEDGELMLIDDDIPGLFFEGKIAFLPDQKNKPNPFSCSIPTNVYWHEDWDGAHLRVWEIIRYNLHPDFDGCDYAQERVINLPVGTLIFKAGLAPHQPCSLMDQQCRASHDEMLEREQRTRRTFKKSVRLRNRIDLRRA